MALKQMENICDEMIEKFNIQTISILHRIGEVPISEASVIIVAVSAHRKAAIEATSEAIDVLK
jgi:molybdopterin synthase catalytic subunit